MVTIDDLCANLEAATEQRKHEKQAGLGEAGTMGYEKMGCYDPCNGYKYECPAYIPMTIFEEHIVKGYD